jgi:hypothetical protein
MKRIRYLIIVLSMLFSSVTSAGVQVGIGIGLPHVSIGINFPVYPDLVIVPGYPVYYAPRQQANLFFYDGLYWVYQDDYWYTSSWYNAPWWTVEPEFIPVFILRVPVRYYRHPPAYFAGWRYDSAPRWGDHWGLSWSQRRSGWDRWDRRSVPQPAPQPTYQRKYSGERYPQQIEQQHELHQNNYRYQPRDPVVKQHYKEQAEPRKSSQQEQQPMREEQGNRGQDNQRPGASDRDNVRTPRSGEQQKRDTDVQQSAPVSPQKGRPEVQNQRQQQPDVEQRGQQGTATPARQDSNSGRDNPANMRTQPPKDGGVNVQKPDRSTSQQGRPESQELQRQDRQQQPRQEQQQRSQQPQGKSIANDPARKQEQERGSSHYD